MNPYTIPGIAKIKNKDFRQIRKDSIFKKVCKHYGQDPNKIKSDFKTRKREYVEIRQITMSLIKLDIHKVSWAESGSYFNKDHATALHAAKTVLNLWDTDKAWREEVQVLFGGERPDFEFERRK